MEFFQEIHNDSLDNKHLKELLTINNLTILCASINTSTPLGENKGSLYCVWGEFDVNRLELRYGIRFSLLNCPHALTWSITLDDENKLIIVHCTTDKTEHDIDFVESIIEFVDDWKTGIKHALQ